MDRRTKASLMVGTSKHHGPPYLRFQQQRSPDCQAPLRDRQPRSRHRQPRSRHRQPRSRDRQLRSRDRQLRSLAGQPPSRDCQPPSRDCQPRSRDRQPRSRDRQPRSRDRQLRSRNRQPRSRDRQPCSRDRPPRSRDRQPPSRGRQLPSRNRQPPSRNGQLQQLHRVMGKRAVFGANRPSEYVPLKRTFAKPAHRCGVRRVVGASESGSVTEPLAVASGFSDGPKTWRNLHCAAQPARYRERFRTKAVTSPRTPNREIEKSYKYGVRRPVGAL
jgi:hypothetical protein